jgi:hypothetical protein
MTERSRGGGTIGAMTSSYRPREISPWRVVEWVVIGALMFWPRLFILGFLIFDRDIGRAFGSWVVPLIGFFVLPWTTLAYAAMWSVSSQGVSRDRVGRRGLRLARGSLHLGRPAVVRRQRAGTSGSTCSRS